MATATKKASVPSVSSGSDSKAPYAGSPLDLPLRAIDLVYRFLASLKLAVISLSSLAAALAVGTFFERSYGTAAAQDYVYQSTWFAILLAFLATNILCAALIRFPWKKRQTGFVITHLGLLVLIFGSYFSFKTADEGMVTFLEGESRANVVRRQAPVLRVRELDPHTQEAGPSYDILFKPGPFPWGEGQAHLHGMFDLVLSSLSGGSLPVPSQSGESLSQPGDPFKLVVKKHLPSSSPAILRQTDPAGVPMAKINLQFKAPGMSQAQEASSTDLDQWYTLDRRFYRVARSNAPATVTFAYVDRPELIEDFLKPPMTSGPRGVARFRYPDSSGKTRVFDLNLEGQEGKSLSLPDSDLTVKVEKVADFPAGEGGLSRVLGESAIPLGMFQVSKGNGSPVEHFAMASLPMVPNVMPNPREPGAKAHPPLVSIHLMILPDLDPKTNGKFGQIDVLAGPDHSLYYRVFGRGKEGKADLRSAGPIAKGKTVNAFGGAAGMPMTISFQVEDYIPAGVEKHIFEPRYLPISRIEEAVPASLIEMTVGDVTQEIWIQRSENSEGPSFKPVPFGDRLFEIAYDVSRRPLDFELKLDKFERDFEPGTEQPTKFVSQVRLSDSSQAVTAEPHTISMNEPLSHRGFTFYQMRYSEIQDPDTGQSTGQFQSVLQVGSDPGRPIKYAGCLLLVLGIFTQFYMRAGVFTDGGKKERERAARKQSEPQTRTRNEPGPGDELERL
jgi:ResB-like family